MASKSVLEIVLMPMVVAIIGVAGTYFITNAQEQAANELAKTQQDINIIETFSDKITSTDVKERELALSIISTVNKELSDTIFVAINNTGYDVKKVIDGQTYSLAADSLARSKAASTENEVNDNSRYTVGIYALAVSDDAFETAVESVRNENFSIVAQYLLEERPNWLSRSSTVHFYSAESEQKAQELADLLGLVTNGDFDINRGAGLGVPQNEKETRLFVHYVQQSEKK